MPSKDYCYKTYGGGQPIEATVHYDGRARTQQRVVMAIHGGGYTVGSKEMIPQAQIDYLIRNGLVVVSVNHRLCPQVSVADGPVADIRDAYHWCRDSLPQLLEKDASLDIDGSRIVVLGHSSGGHLALLLGLESPRPNAILNFYGTLYLRDEHWTKPVAVPGPELPQEFMDKILDEPTQTGSSQLAVTRPKDEKSGMDCRTAWLLDKMRSGSLVSTLFSPWYDALDPSQHWDESFPPTFFAHGSEDKLVIPEISQRAHQALKDLRVETEISIFEGGGHGYDSEIKDEGPDWERGVKRGLNFLIAHA